MLTRRGFIKNTSLTSGLLLASGIAFGEAESAMPGTFETSFLHGVASGDVSSTSVIIWTRITGKEETAVKWQISMQPDFQKIEQSGELQAVASRDFTIKIEISNLSPATTYYYQFIVANSPSATGRTKTASDNESKELSFAIVSCSDFAAGFYNSYANIAWRKDIDAVIHLGDYIYEGTKRSFDQSENVSGDEFEETHFNRNRNWWLHYYRRRYALNRLDPDLQAAHQAHAFITIWDDHEIANNAWKDGAQGHHPAQDGDWEERKSAARQAYSEWVPIRGNADKIYRSVRYGKMAELIFLDTRIEGRDQQIYNSADPAILAPARTILGKEQKNWLLDKLSNSTAQWKLIVNQVIFSEINVKWAAMGGRFREKVVQLENTLLDYWEGYPAERDEVMTHISEKKLNDVIILSASMHCALAFDVTRRATSHSRAGEPATYNAESGKGSIAVEFAASSITSANFDEKMDKFYANTFQSLLNKKLPAPLGGYNPNPHLKFADLQRHGYFILRLKREGAEASFYFINQLQTRDKSETAGEIWHTKSGKNQLEKGKI